MTEDRLEAEISRVVELDNCSGCGVCAAASSRVSMKLSRDGFLRPTLTSECGEERKDGAEADDFRKYCPGVSVRARRDGGGDPQVHPIFGRYVESWQGWAADPSIRRSGSSGGVITALTSWMIATGRVPNVATAAADEAAPAKTAAQVVNDPADCSAAAGSRYAPVAVGATFLKVIGSGAMVGKPCEIAGARALADVRGTSPNEGVFISFFCAGTPSQNATHSLVESLGMSVDTLSSLAYRGDGWPGSFRVVGRDGSKASLSYADSWGGHLGRALQTRCKFCVDGTGNDADISVGDFWDSDDLGFPSFNEGEGNSVIIARTAKGQALVKDAVKAGILTVASVELDAVARMQPLQVSRKRTLVGRLAARKVLRRPGPSYEGFKLWRLAARSIRGNGRAFAGAVKRSRKPALPTDW